MEVHSPTVRADVDIAADIDAIIVRYPPLAHDRGHLQVSVNNGVAAVAGHVRSFNTRDYFLQALAGVDGLKSVNADYLHADEAVRLALGQVIPAGVITTVEYGTVVFSGRLPEGISADEVVSRAGGVPGVRRVVAVFRD